MREPREPGVSAIVPSDAGAGTRQVQAPARGDRAGHEGIRGLVRESSACSSTGHVQGGAPTAVCIVQFIQRRSSSACKADLTTVRWNRSHESKPAASAVSPGVNVGLTP